ncbi:2-oxo acid dehydrogenase subunit E2 [Christiangramia sp.]|uniref:2-oxo acid dehydrogenase subunit E2 n=1 Tax=Christiangramia sp. TaxID=1931228 RepID=UPI00260DA8AB|nr:2-oxo acid dehydrogenase subunit E2 [Christiangramia sp.]
MAKEIKIPQIAEGVESATVTEILVREGDSIEKDQSIIAVESDKASVEIPSPQAGTVKSISVSEGDEVEVGDVILELEAEDSDEKEEKSKEEKEEDTEEDSEEKAEARDKKKEEKSKKEKDSDSSKDKDKADSEDDSEEEKVKKSEKDNQDSEDKDSKKEEKKESEEESEKESEEKSEKKKEKDADKEDTTEEKRATGENVPAAPGVRRLARELGIDISKVKGSGENGRISKEDVKNHSNDDNQKKSSPELSLPDFSKWGETERKPLSGIRKATAKNTSAAWSNIPHVFQFDEADISEIEIHMEKLQKKAETKITITAILAKLAATALRQFPKFNASIDMENEEMILKKYVNIGIAVDTEKGLLVPVIRNVDQKTIIEISEEITQLAEKARAGKLSSEEMKGGNFTISNLGGIGGTNFTPIVYYPQVAILGVSRAKKQPVYVDGDLEPRDMLPLSLSYDHRMIDGAEGVRFLHWISRALEDPYEALLGA